MRGAPRSGEDGSGSSKGYRSGTAAGRGAGNPFRPGEGGWHFREPTVIAFKSHADVCLRVPSWSHQVGLTKQNQSVMKLRGK